MAEVKKQQEAAKKEPLKDEELEKVTGGAKPCKVKPWPQGSAQVLENRPLT